MNLSRLRSRAWAGTAISFVLHGLILALGGYAVAEPAQYAVAAGMGGVEVHLVAAPAPPIRSVPAPVKEPAPLPEPEPVPAPEDIVEPEPRNDGPPSAPEPIRQEPDSRTLRALDALQAGDGSSSVPGEDPTTFHSTAGSITEAKPNYLRNPAPAYPRQARDRGWEGAVLMTVHVDASGRVLSAELEKSSGYAVLDDSALRTVRKWRFSPARFGGIAVSSIVRVPVRFEIESGR